MIGGIKMTNQEMDRFSQIPQQRKELLIQLCMRATLQQQNNTVEQLNQNKANIKSQICRENSLEQADAGKVKLEIDFVEFVCSQILQSRDSLTFIEGQKQQESVRKMFEELGVLDKQEQEAKKYDEVNEKNLQYLYQPELLKDSLIDNRNKAIRYGQYDSSKTQIHTFTWKDETITIKRIGLLEFQNQFGVESYLNEYLITRQNAKGENTEVETVYTNLSIGKVEGDADYQKTVLEKLLSHQNLHLKNAHRYIGEIMDAEGFERMENKYQIEYLPESYTAVVELEKELQKRKEQRKKEEQEER